MVLEFCQRLSEQIDFKDKYVYAVINYAGHTEAAYLTFKKKLPKLDSLVEVTMLGNIILRSFKVNDMEGNSKILADSENKMYTIIYELKEIGAVLQATEFFCYINLS